ncbi:hypothetical protein D3C85_1398910 [compost metagenome]
MNLVDTAVIPTDQIQVILALWTSISPGSVATEMVEQQVQNNRCLVVKPPNRTDSTGHAISLCVIEKEAYSADRPDLRSFGGA